MIHEILGDTATAICLTGIISLATRSIPPHRAICFMAIGSAGLAASAATDGRLTSVAVFATLAVWHTRNWLDGAEGAP